MLLMPRTPGAVMLDVGCADDRDTVRVAEYVGAGRVLGLELSELFIAQSLQR